MPILLLTILFFGIAMLIMAVGVIFKRPCLRGSCGGADILDAQGDSLACSTCPKRKERDLTALEQSRVALPIVKT